MQTALTFGPVPSRRLGRSLGINNIPPKACPYACVYCQVGATLSRTVTRRDFYAPEQILREVATRVDLLRQGGERIDALTFVPDGEPTLDRGLGSAIELLRPLGIRIAVISNGSLLDRPDVRAALMGADWVSVKVDAADLDTWRRVNHPDVHLDLATVQRGIRRFVAEFGGHLVSETMLVRGVNDSPASVRRVARFLRETGIGVAYLAVPTRPTPSASVGPPSEDVVTRAYHDLAEHVPHVELLVGYEGNDFASSGDARADLLSIAAVHPLRRSAVAALLDRCGAGWDVVDDLESAGLLVETTYRGDTYFLRRFGVSQRYSSSTTGRVTARGVSCSDRTCVAISAKGATHTSP